MNTPLFFAAMTAQRLGARITWWRMDQEPSVWKSDLIRSDVTHVVCDPLRCSAVDLRAIQKRNADRVLVESADNGRRTSFKVVLLAWVTASQQAGELADEKRHIFHASTL